MEWVHLFVCSFQAISLKMKIILISLSFPRQSAEIIFGRTANNIVTSRMVNQFSFFAIETAVQILLLMLCVDNSRCWIHWKKHNILCIIDIIIESEIWALNNARWICFTFYLDVFQHVVSRQSKYVDYTHANIGMKQRSM